MKRRLLPTQLALPLDYSASDLVGLPQNREPSKRRHSHFLRARLGANLATLARLGTVPGSFYENADLNYFRQGHIFSFTTTLSSPPNL